MTPALEDGAVRFADRFSISLQRTLRVPDDGGRYPLPPGLGRLPLIPAPQIGLAADARRPTFVVPMYQREALWIGFSAAWPPMAVQVMVGMVNVVSGRPWRGGLHADPQDYVVAPEQLWIDGINAGPGVVRQFVAMPLGSGYSVEQAITGGESAGGIQLAVYPPKPGVDLTPPPSPSGPQRKQSPRRMGIAAGGRIAQKIYPDPHGIDVWDQDAGSIVRIEILNSEQFQQATGRTPPPTPIDARTYTEHGLPWFALYEEDKGDVAAPDALSSAPSLADHDRRIGSPDAGDRVIIDPAQIRDVRPDKA